MKTNVCGGMKNVMNVRCLPLQDIKINKISG